MSLWKVINLLVMFVSCVRAYNVGAGIADITGPAAQVNMMGYAHPDQNTEGIHMRLYSRAFIFTDSKDNRVVFVSIDAGMVGQLVKIKVVEKLKSMFGNVYTEENVCISGIHTHSGPGGYLQYVLYDVTSLGFIRESFDAQVNGIVMSIRRAHENIEPASITMSEGELLNSSINRSPTAYMTNPSNERARYKYDTDKMMTLLKIVADKNSRHLGMINWFAVHCTSMNNTNKLISGDNKGYASYLFEKQCNPHNLSGKGDFVAAFAQSNLGDVSPNTKGPHCLDTGEPCDTVTSTCHGKNQLCVASGPGADIWESTKIIGRNQFEKAKELYQTASTQISGEVGFRHMFVDMSDQTVKLPNQTVKTCKPSMGYAFAAGTTDGPGAFNFHQSSTKGNLFWNILRDMLKKPSREQKACHLPKPILLDTGEIKWHLEWQPNIVSIQIFRIGQFVICAVPGEFTTMAGRRLRNSVYKTLVTHGFPHETKVVIAGLSNAYASYITTFEEYQVQRYEGGSTIHGPHTLQAYMQNFDLLAKHLATGTSNSAGPPPPDMLNNEMSFLPGVILDHAPLFKHFGDVVTDVEKTYPVGSTVSVVFIAANLRNNLMTESTFLKVMFFNDVKKHWLTVLTDSDWDTRLRWKQTSALLGESQVIISWHISEDTQPGKYKISHSGYYKHIDGGKHAYSGNSSTFEVTKSNMPTSLCHQDSYSVCFLKFMKRIFSVFVIL